MLVSDLASLFAILAAFMPVAPSHREAFTFERDGYACLCVRIDEPDEHPPPPYGDELNDEYLPCPPSE